MINELTKQNKKHVKSILISNYLFISAKRPNNITQLSRISTINHFTFSISKCSLSKSRHITMRFPKIGIFSIVLTSINSSYSLVELCLACFLWLTVLTLSFARIVVRFWAMKSKKTKNTKRIKNCGLNKR